MTEDALYLHERIDATITYITKDESHFISKQEFEQDRTPTVFNIMKIKPITPIK